MNIRVAICQLTPISEKPKENLILMEAALKKCSKKRVRLCIFPEDFLYGIIRGSYNVKVAGIRFPHWVRIFSRLAKKYSVDLIPGSFPLHENGKLYNTTIYVNSMGKVVHRCCKTNLWLSERKEYTPSSYPMKVFKSVLGKTAIILCWDLMDHTIFEQAVKQDAEWVIVVSFWSTNQSKDLATERGKTKRYPGNGDSPLIDALLRARVYEYGLGVIFCNYANIFKYKNITGQWDTSISAGHSQILSPLGQVSRKASSRKENILICEIPEIKHFIRDQEIFYGRREDVLTDYPHQTIL